MTTLTIQIQGKLGHERSVMVWADGEEMTFDHKLSRILTKSMREDGYGIFTECYEDINFYRGSAHVRVSFESDWDTDNKSVSQIMEDVVERVARVTRAFEEKYPALKERLSKEF